MEVGIDVHTDYAAYCLLPTRMTLPLPILASCVFLLQALPAFGWMDPAWMYRRPIDVDWVADRATGDELVMADFYTGGALRDDGADLRITTQDGRLLPARLLMHGPGDRVRVAFPAVRNVSRYYAYFGNAKAPAAAPELSNVAPSAGLTMEMRELATDAVGNFAEIEKAWQAATVRLGRTIVPNASLGINPFGPQQRTISRFEGQFPVGFDGDYVFALSADDRAAIFIDGKPVVFAAQQVADVRISGTASLKAGKRSLVIYHVNLGGEGVFAIAYRRAENQRWQPLAGDTLGIPLRGKAGALEQTGKAVTADFAIQYEGESFFADGYSHRYQFTALAPSADSGTRYEWDFGNGQTATGGSATQVYLADGVYAVRMTARRGEQSETRVHRLSVSRNWEWTDRPTEEPVERHALVVAGYRADRVPVGWLPRAAMLFARSGKLNQALSAASLALQQAAVTTDNRLPDPEQSYVAATEVATDAVAAGRVADAIRLWEMTSKDSPLQPRAARSLALLHLWRQGDAASAVKALTGHPRDDVETRRAYGQALVLAGQPAEGRKVLEALPVYEPQRKAAIAGAAARSVEFYITTKDAEAGQEAWDLWQQRYPADFLDGYAVLLKVKLLELQGAPIAAAHIAEAYSRALPDSPYSPRLIYRASRLIGESDLPRSLSLQKLLKDRYPEVPTESLND